MYFKTQQLFIIALLPLQLLAGCSGEKSAAMTTKPIVIAHRGASGYAPENTLASFQKGIDLKADVVELDVHLTKDGQVIVIHDATIDRTTNGEGDVHQYTLEEIQKFDAGSWFDPKFKDEHLPTLQQVLDLVQGKATVLIEIKKGESGFYEGIEQKVLDIIKQNNASGWCEVQSFNDHYIDNWIAIDSTIVLYKLVAGKIGPLFYDDGLKTGEMLKWQGRVKGFNINQNFASRKFIKNLHEHGFVCYPWTVNDEDDIKELLEDGADGIITNFPDKVKR